MVHRTWLRASIVTLAVLMISSMAGAQTPQQAPPSAEYLHWLEKAAQKELVTTDDEGHGLGFVPEPMDWSHLSAAPEKNGSGGQPASYDLRSASGGPYVTAVRNQGTSGTCWAFASIASVESNFLVSRGETWDFSENNVALQSGFDWDPLNGGGNTTMSMAYMSRWDGPCWETDDPYGTNGNDPGTGSQPFRKRVDTMYIYNTATEIKNGIVNYGAVVVSMLWDSGDGYNAGTYVFRRTDSIPDGVTGDSTDHLVCIVGWDDTKVHPGGTGCWIIRNSWGTSWGESGYFYIAYDSTDIVNSLANGWARQFCDAGPNTGATTNYHHDPLGQTSTLGYGSTTCYAANRFVPTSNDTLSAVATNCMEDGTSYEIRIYSTKSGNTFSGQMGSTVTGTWTFAGNQVVDLPSAVSLTSGDDFYIWVKYTCPSYTFPVPIEGPSSGWASPTASANESFASSSGAAWADITTWGGDWASTNACIKGLGGTSSTPVVTSVTRLNASPTNQSTVGYQVVFSTNVTGVDTTDFSITTTGTLSGTSVTNVSGSGTTYSVTVSTGSGDGMLRLDVTDDDTIVNASTSDPLGGTGTGNGDYTSGQLYFVDKTAPTIGIGAPSVSATASGPVDFVVTYTGADSVTLSTGDVTLNRTGTANGVVSVSGSGTDSRTVTVSSVVGEGTIGISIASGTAQDAATNSAPAAGPSATCTVDNTAPTISIGAPSVGTTASGPVDYVVTYTGADSVTLSTGDVTLNRTGTANGVVSVSGSGTDSRTVTVSSMVGIGTIGISIASGTAQDAATNPAPAAGPSDTCDVTGSITIDVYNSTDVPKTIADLATITSTIEVSPAKAVAEITDVNVTLDITHTRDEDLDVYLTSPEGTIVELFTDVGGTGSNFTNTTLDDSAATSITAGTAAFTGTYQPEGNLSDFVGESALGTWTLSIYDDASGETGTLNSWSLEVATDQMALPVGGIVGVGILGLTLSGAGYLALRRKLRRKRF